MRVEAVSDVRAFESLRGEWNDFRRSAGCRNAYLRHEWLAAWWVGFGTGGTLEIGLLRDGDALAGVIPLMRSRRTLAGLPVTALHFLGSNVAHLEASVLPAIAAQGHATLLQWALRRRGVDLLLLHGLPAEGEQAAAARKLDRSGAAAVRFLPCDELVLHAREGIETYRQARGRKFWSNVRNRTRRLSELGALTYDRRRTAGEVAGALEEAFDLSTRSWKGRSGTAVGLRSTHRAYLADMLRRFGEAGGAELWLLRLGGRAIAYRIGFRDGPRYVECDIAYDEEYRPFSPGTLLAVECNERLIHEGVEEINLGMAFGWKEEWSPEPRRRVEAQILPARPYAFVLRAAQSLRGRWPFARGGRDAG